MRIAAISLRCDGATPGAGTAGSYNFALDLSTSRNAVGALVTTFADNHGFDRLRVRSGALSIAAPSTGASPNAFALRIPLATPFDWDPRNGPLLLDLAYNAATPAFGQWDATNVAVGGLSANGATAPTATSVLTVAPVLQIETAADVLPSTAANAEASASGTSQPWGLALISSQSRVLQLYDAAAFAAPGRRRITGLAFRADSGVAFAAHTYTVRITLSTSPNTTLSINSTFANNHGPDQTVVFDGTLNAPASPASADFGQFDLFVPLARAFEFDPAAGSLAVDLQLFGHSGGSLQFDCTNLIGAGTARMTATTANAAIGFLQGGVALVMALRSVPIPTVPSSLANAVNPSTNSPTSFPFGTNQSRSLSLLTTAEAGITQPFVVRHLRFRPPITVASGGPTTFTVTVDLSHAPTTPATMSSTYDSNHGSDRQRVLAGDVSVPFFSRATSDPEFPIELKLDRPFLWNPATSAVLAVDIRVTAKVGNGFFIETTNGFSTNLARMASSNPNATVGAPQSLAPVVQLGGAGQNGLAVNEGAGCFGTNGVPQATTIGRPSLPNPAFQVRVRNAAGNAAAFFLAGFAPLAITLPNTAGCTILNGGEVGVLGGVITDALGDGVLAVPLLGSPAADGFQFRGQWLVLDAANAFGIVTSDGQLYTARWF